MAAFSRHTRANRDAEARVTPPLISDLAVCANRGAAFAEFRSTAAKRSTWTDAHMRPSIMPRVEIAMTAKCATAKK